MRSDRRPVIPAKAGIQSLSAGRDVILREAMYLDEQRWDEWLALYTEDCEFWMPAWKSDGTMTADPRSELSHIYYAGRRGLEDRIVRIRSGKSPASTPMPRTAHLLSSILPLEPPGKERMRLRSTWACHVVFLRTGENHAFFGRYEHELVLKGGGWKIAKKKILLQNDRIPTMLDIYCI